MRPVTTPDPATAEATLAAIAEEYREHAAMFAPESACFAAWANAVAEDPEVLALLAGLPHAKRQPNLVFAAARWHGAPAPGPYAALRDALLGPRCDAVLATIRARHTQTNEVARLACLTPALGLLGEEPIALVELGTSAGLNLFPDRYDYSWPGAGTLAGSGGPTLRCATTGPLPVPTRHPRIAARIGVDRNPLDVYSDDDMTWLQTLVWPEQSERRMRLRRAIETARGSRITVLAGDLLERLDGALERAATSGAVPVVMHSATIAYLDTDDRVRFQRTMTERVAAGSCHWLSLEGQTVLPELTATAPSDPPDPYVGCLALDGRAVAWAHLHGIGMRWL